MAIRAKVILVAGVVAAVMALGAYLAMPSGTPEDHTHPHDEAVWTWELPGFLQQDDAEANSTSYCPKYDYRRNGYYYDYRFSYVQGNTHYHRYIRTPGLVTINRSCALV